MYEDPSTPDSINYKQKYHALKKKIKLLVYEQECFVDELRKSQRKLLKVSRDRSFLLDRLLQYENIDASSSDSESTASSESVNETVKDNTSAVKKKRPNTSQAGNSSSVQSTTIQGMQFSSTLSSPGEIQSGTSGRILKEPPKKKQKVARKLASKVNTSKLQSSAVNVGSPVKGLALNSIPISSSGLLSREEIERHLDLKHSSKPQFLSIDMMTPHSLPDDIFCHDNSNQDCPIEIVKIESEDTDLVIDMT
jgi:INO80 complex subunit E